VSYLLDQRVNLALFQFEKEDPLPADTQVIRVPITPGHWVDVVYLLKADAVDEVVRREGWQVRPYVRF
jgi:hypothetical protein